MIAKKKKIDSVQDLFISINVFHCGGVFFVVWGWGFFFAFFCGNSAI